MDRNSTGVEGSTNAPEPNPSGSRDSGRQRYERIVHREEVIQVTGHGMRWEWMSVLIREARDPSTQWTS